MTRQCIDLKYGQLWIDGSRSIKPELISQYLGQDNIYVTEYNEEINQYNEFADKPLKIKKDVLFDVNWLEWNIPQEYKDINLKDYVMGIFTNFASENDINEELYYKRIKTELKLVTKYKLEDLFKTAMYVVDQFYKHQIVWGVGRGSSVSCFLLYLIGIHDIDSVKYELDYNEFFHN